MGMPVLLYLGHIFLKNNYVRYACATIALCMMIAVTIMAMLTARWIDLVWPGMGVIAWLSLDGIRKMI